VPFQHHAIHRHLAAWLDQHLIARFHAAYRRHLFLPIAHYGRYTRLQFHQAVGGGNRLMAEHAL
jgi:hypothetical protein